MPQIGFNSSMPSLYIAVFLILSATISWAPWPPRYRRTGLWLAGGALLLAVLLSWQVQTVSGSWFALTQKLELLARVGETAPGRWLAAWLNPLVVLLAVAGHLSFPGLLHGLGVGVVYLFLFLFAKGCLLPILYLLQRGRGQAGWHASRPRARHWQTRTTTNLAVVVLALPLTLLPLGLARLPVLQPALSQPLWMGLWIVLLELRLWASRRPPR